MHHLFAGHSRKNGPCLAQTTPHGVISPVGQRFEVDGGGGHGLAQAVRLGVRVVPAAVKEGGEWGKGAMNSLKRADIINLMSYLAHAACL